MDSEDVICSGASECKKLKGATHITHCAGKEIIQRPEYCSGRRPHRFQHEEDSPHFCIFINKHVESKRLFQKAWDW